MPTNMRSRVPPAARRLSVNSTSTSNKQVLRKTRQRSIDNQLRINENEVKIEGIEQLLEEKLPYITYYNGNNLYVQSNTGNSSEEFVYGGISAWQGARSLQKDLVYLLCGTTFPTPQTGYGLIYKGNISCTNGELYYLNVPESIGTSVYGPNYDLVSGLFSFVGSYTTSSNNKTLGFYYEGYLDENNLSNPVNFKYPGVNNDYDITFVHSTMGEFMVGASGIENDSLSTVSFLYKTSDLDTIYLKIEYPNSYTTTTYGIWLNSDGTYTIVGGYSPNRSYAMNEIYNMDTGMPVPIGEGFIATYNPTTNEITDWTSLLPSESGLLLHIEGISKFADSNLYSINIDTLDPGTNLQISYYTTMQYIPHLNGYVVDRNFKKLDYPQDNGAPFNVSSSNSVADNNIVGLHITSLGNVSFQAKIN